MHPSCKFELAILLEFAVEASLQHCTLHLPLSLDLMVVVDMPKLASPIEFLETTGTVIVLYISILILYSTYATHTQRLIYLWDDGLRVLLD